MLQEPVQRWLKKSGGAAHDSGKWLAGAAVFQFFVGVYGGYFGAGIGILMLAALSISRRGGIHRMNGLKNLFALCINWIGRRFIFSQPEWCTGATRC
jgi:uncharacterized membrane protein YfcA